MPKFRYSFGGDAANWEENLYHRSFSVQNGVIAFDDDDDLAVDALLRRGWEQLDDAAVETEEEATAKAKPARARATT